MNNKIEKVVVSKSNLEWMCIEDGCNTGASMNTWDKPTFIEVKATAMRHTREAGHIVLFGSVYRTRISETNSTIVKDTDFKNMSA